MGAAVNPPETSLERLKALDSLPSLDVQLDEARQLCNHSARADMVVKWILEKFKKSPDAAASPDCWRLTHSACRLLSPVKIATLLGARDVFQIMASIMASEVLPVQGLLPQLAAFCRYLFEASDGPDGLALKAMLSMNAEKAAPLVGNWLEKVHVHLSSNGEEVFAMHDTEPLLLPAINFWRSRRRQVDENELFAEHCLVHATALLSTTSSIQVNAGKLSSLKRRRDNEQPRGIDVIKQSLETMLAKHVFVPARNTFFRPHTASSGSQDGENKPADLQQVLAPVKEKTCLSDSIASTYLPILLDVALRCIQTTTSSPKQRLKERPWVESVFMAIFDCCLNKGELSDTRALRALLSVAKARGFVLSTSVLSRLHSTYATTPRLSSLLPKSWDWELIAEIVGMDVEVYTESTITPTLFNQISHASNVFMTDSDVSLDRSEEIKYLLRNSILIPVMTAFSKGRKFTQFMTLWHEQLLGDDQNRSGFPWLEIVADCGEFVEESLTESQISDLIFSFLTTLARRSPKKAAKVETFLPDFAATIILLNALLSGLYSDAKRNAFYQQAGEAFEHLSALFDDKLFDPFLKTSDAFQSCTWGLLTNAFEFWYPRWLIHQQDRHSVSEGGLKILGSTMVRIASKTITSTPASSDRKAEQSKRLRCEMFVCSLTNTFYPYAECIGVVGELLGCLPLQHEALLQYPHLLDASHVVRSRVLAINPARPGAFHATISSSAISSSNQSVNETVTSICKVFEDYNQNGPAEQSDTSQTLLCLQAIADLAPSSLSREQQKLIVDGLVNLKLPSREFDEFARDLFRWRLVALNQFMQTPMPTNQVVNDLNILWGLVDSSFDSELLDDGSYLPPAISDDPEILALIEEAVRYVLRQAFAPKVRNQDNIDGFSRVLSAYILCMANIHDFGESPASLSIIKVSLKELALHMTNEDLSSLLGIDTVVAYRNSLIREITQTVQIEGRVAVMDALLHFPSELVMESEKDTKQFCLDLKSALSPLLQLKALSLENQDQIHSERNQWLHVLPFQLACKLQLWATPEAMARRGAELLSMKLQPRQQHLLLTSVRENALTTFNTGTKVVLLEHLLSSKEEVSSVSLASAILIAHAIIASLRKDDFAKENETEDEVDDERERDQTRATRISYQILAQAADNLRDVHTRREAYETSIQILREKSFMTNQAVVEMALVSLTKLSRQLMASSSSPAIESVLAPYTTRLFTVLLQQHRARLQDRWHLLVNLAQALIAGIFRWSRAVTTTKASGRKILIRHTQAVARVLQLLCDPPPMHGRQRSRQGQASLAGSSDLVDEARKAKARAGQHIRYVLHLYTAETLLGALSEDVRSVLVPGLWTMIEAIETDDTDGLKVLGAAMTNSERAILRSVYEDYRLRGKRNGV